MHENGEKNSCQIANSNKLLKKKLMSSNRTCYQKIGGQLKGLYNTGRKLLKGEVTLPMGVIYH